MARKKKQNKETGCWHDRKHLYHKVWPCTPQWGCRECDRAEQEPIIIEGPITHGRKEKA